MLETNGQIADLLAIYQNEYPDRFADTDPDAIRREYAQESGFGNEDVEWFYSPFESGTVTSAGGNATVRNSAGG